jgi:hypothetical protein
MLAARPGAAEDWPGKKNALRLKAALKITRQVSIENGS